MKRIGFIGYGLRSETMLKAFRALEADICVAAVADPRHAQIAPGTKDDPYFAETRWYEDAAPLLARDDLDGVFIAVGMTPETEIVSKLLQTDETGYIVAGEDTATSQPGIFAAGDIRTKALRQIITAAADGANAAIAAQKYLMA